MHARHLAELAISIATHTDELLHSPTGIAEVGIGPYWSAAKRRLDRWQHSIATSTTNIFREAPTEKTIALAEEVLASEILTRVWTAMLSAQNISHAKFTTDAAARSILIGHQSVYGQVLKWMLTGPVSKTPAGNKLNLLRRHCERWTDLLLAKIQLSTDATEYSFDAERQKQYTQDFAEDQQAGKLSSSWTTLSASIENAMRHELTKEPTCPKENADIADALFLSLGPLLMEAWKPASWSVEFRAEQLTNSTMQLLDALVVIG